MRRLILCLGLVPAFLGCQAKPNIETSRSPSRSAESSSLPIDAETTTDELNPIADEIATPEGEQEQEPLLEQEEPEQAQVDDGIMGVGSVSPVYGSKIPHKKTSRTSLRQAGMEIEGDLSADLIWGTLSNTERGLKNCYDVALADQADLAGLVEIIFVIVEDGDCVSAVVGNKTSPELKGVANCFARRIKLTRFPEPREESPNSVFARFKLSPTGGKSLR
jgi:hypothetical protein